jgi:DNA repair protein RadA/Sms
MLLAVLDARCGLSFSTHDVYLNVAGGLRITEPAADLAAAGALASALFNVPLPADSVLFGEVALSGLARAVSQNETRLKEAAKLGFARAFVPKGQSIPNASLACDEIETLQDLIDAVRRGA